MTKRRRTPHKIKRKKSIFRRRLFWFFLLFLIIILVFSYFLFFSDKFYVKKIKVTGNEKIATEDIKKIVSDKLSRNFFDIIKTRSIFLIPEKEIRNKILKDYPKIGNVEIKRKLFDTLILKIEERKPMALFCQGNECFLIDKNGVIFESSKTTPKELEIRLFEKRQNLSLPRKIITKKILGLILKIEKNLKEKFDVTTKEVFTDQKEKLNFKTVQGWKIYFNLEKDIDLQITKLNLLLEKEISPEERKILNYIDLRFSRVFVSPPEVL